MERTTPGRPQGATRRGALDALRPLGPSFPPSLRYLELIYVYIIFNG